MQELFRVIIGGLLIATGLSALAVPLTFRDLMKPEMFPNAQYGMAVKDYAAKGDTISIITTGARVMERPYV